ncbi:MAG: hypothetical protein JWM00_791 [Candidatus Saccharibacteria bacterium]|nr:hypothetical protein [Candidatus Saccharibacteria bacterium]
MADSPSVNVEIIELDAFKAAVNVWFNNRALQLLMGDVMDDITPTVNLMIDGAQKHVYITGVREATPYLHLGHRFLVDVVHVVETSPEINHMYHVLL